VTALAVFRPTCAVCFKLYWLKCVLLLCTYSANMTWRDALDQVKKLRLAARSQLLNCNVHADRGNVCYYGSWCCSLSFFCCGCHQTSFWVVNSVVVARRNSGLLPILRTLVFFLYRCQFWSKGGWSALCGGIPQSAAVTGLDGMCDSDHQDYIARSGASPPEIAPWFSRL